MDLLNFITVYIKKNIYKEGLPRPITLTYHFQKKIKISRVGGKPATGIIF